MMARRESREAYLALVRACLTDLFGLSQAAADELLARLRRSRRLALAEHVEAYLVAHELAHPGAGDLEAAAALRAHRARYNRLIEQVFNIDLGALVEGAPQLSPAA
jgi:hypothetical protein